MQLWAASAKQFHIPSSVLFTVCLAVLITSSWAENNSNYIFNGTTTNFGGAFTVGNNGTNNLLEISNAGAVTNTTGTLGTGPNGAFNSAYITNSGSIWVNTGDLRTGFDFGANSNRLIIADSGRVESLNGYPGYFGDYNSVLIDGASSIWNIAGAGNGYFELGIFGHDNSLTIQNGGRLINANQGYVGVVNGANSNTVLVTGANSHWSNGAALLFGYNSAYNTMTIVNSGRVDNTTAYVGGFPVAGGSNATHNSITVSGTGSVWNSTGEVNLGYYGGGNVLIITNGGQVNSTQGFLGRNAASASNNTAVVTGAGSLWTNSLTGGNNGMNVGYQADNNQLIIADGGRVDSFNGLIGFFGNNNSVLVTDPNSLWNTGGVGSFFEVGVLGYGNRLTITNGGRVNVNDGYIGGGTTSSNNVMVVTGAGSLFTNVTTFRVGDAGASNALFITSGGRVDNVTGRIGNGAASRNNLAVVDGTGSLWNNTASLTIGQLGSGNTLVITNGGRVNSTNGFVGGDHSTFVSSPSNNTVIVSGAGSLWTNMATGGNTGVTIGSSGAGNRLIISNGGRVDSYNGFLGFYSAASLALPTGSDGNSALITGSNSLWNMTGYFEVGVGGARNEVTISNGGRVQNVIEGYIGAGVDSSNNTVTVTGSGSSWSNGASLYVGFSGSSNRLTISNGARVDATSARVGNNAVSRNNLAVADGTNTLWNNTGDLIVGLQGSANQLIVTNGARVNSLNGFAGGNLSTFVLSPSNNSIVVTGSGSLWTNSATGGNNGVTIGASGGGNSLTISDGGRVDSYNGFIGFYSAAALALPSGSDGNSALITGTNSLWNMTGYLEVGILGARNAVTISNGGRVQNLIEGYIGAGVDSSNNSVTVTGSGSSWSNGASLYVGFSGSSNRLTISDGGRVDNTAGRIGNNTSSKNNLAVVDGTNSLWNNTGVLSIGHDGAGNTLIITNGGRVNSFHGDLGSPSGSAASTLASNNLVIVTGAGSQWTNSSTTGENGIKVGNYASGNQLIIAAGGRADAQDMYLGRFVGSDNNSVTVTGSNSLLNLTRFFDIGTFGQGNQLAVSDGGRVNNVAETRIGAIAGANNNKAVVTGSGSVWSNQSNLVIGDAATGNQLIVTNRGTVFAAQVLVGRGSTGSGSILVEGDGSLLQSSILGTLRVGNTGTTLGNGSVLIRDRGTLEINTLISGSSGSGTISNRQGIYQFTTAAPIVTPLTANSIMLTNGTISYRDVALADINNLQVDNITRQGNNTWRLNHSSNAPVTAYTFESVENTGNSLIYRTLAAINGSLWKAVSTTIGTNGVAVGGSTDTFEFGQNFLIHSTNNIEFNLASSTVLFNGLGHTNAITGRDLGGVDAGFYNNFAYGTLRLATVADEVCFQSGDGAASNALYMTFLDLPLGMTNFVMNLHSPTNINLYYLVTDPRNAYLGGNEYQLTDCDGTTVGGFLLPAVPEPSALALLLAAGALFIARVRRAGR